MGARQSKRSVDITTTPKKGEGENLSAEGKVEKLEEGDVSNKVVTNGTATAHTDIEFADKDEDVKETTTTAETTTTESTEVGGEKSDEIKSNENGISETESTTDKTVSLEVTATGSDQQTPSQDPSATSTTISEEKSNDSLAFVSPASQNGKSDESTPTTTPETKKNKEKSKKKKWSLRSISFSKKDKSKPSSKDVVEKNGEAKEGIEEVSNETSTSVVTDQTSPETETPVAVNGEDKTEDEIKTPAAEIEAPASPAPVIATIAETPAPVLTNGDATKSELTNGNSEHDDDEKPPTPTEETQNDDKTGVELASPIELNSHDAAVPIVTKSVSPAIIEDSITKEIPSDLKTGETVENHSGDVVAEVLEAAAPAPVE